MCNTSNTEMILANVPPEDIHGVQAVQTRRT